MSHKRSALNKEINTIAASFWTKTALTGTAKTQSGKYCVKNKYRSILTRCQAHTLLAELTCILILQLHVQLP